MIIKSFLVILISTEEEIWSSILYVKHGGGSITAKKGEFIELARNAVSIPKDIRQEIQTLQARRTSDAVTKQLRSQTKVAMAY